MITLSKVKESLLTLFTAEASAHKRALSVCIGVYIAFSPFAGLHTLMVVLFSWLLSLNFPLTLASSMLVNNPWTMVPVYGLGYFFGCWFLYLLGLDAAFSNPWWMSGVNSFLVKTVGMQKISLWAFLIGGNVLGIFLALLAYPLVKYMSLRYANYKSGGIA